MNRTNGRSDVKTFLLITEILDWTGNLNFRRSGSAQVTLKYVLSVKLLLKAI